MQDFQVDEDTADFRALHPNAKKVARPVKEHFDLVSEEDGNDITENNISSSSDEDNVRNRPKKQNGQDHATEIQQKGRPKVDAGPR